MPMERSDPKPKIIVLSSRGGGGHIAASEAIKEILKSDYEVEVFNALSDIFGKVDLISRFFRAKFTAEDCYNFFLKKRLFFMCNFYAIAGKCYMALNKSILKKGAKSFFIKHKPVMVVSVIPFFNRALFDACQDLAIPFWIIPTDVELKAFLFGLKNKKNTFNQFKLGLAYEPQISQALNWGLCASKIVKLGFPVKSACVKTYSSKEVNQLKKLLFISKKSKVITLTVGATGTSLFYKLTKVLLKFELSNLEFNCCAGKDLKSYNKVKDLLDAIAVRENDLGERLIYQLASGSRLHLWQFTSSLPEIMVVSDIIISKTGSLSVSEALHLNKYLLLDHTINSSSRFMYWERANVPFVKSINQGEAFYSQKDLIQKLENYLNTPKECSKEVFLNIHQTLLSAVKEEVE
jgi:processive 1,2-diacylglycerol beta-glucosyltransferase